MKTLMLTLVATAALSLTSASAQSGYGTYAGYGRDDAYADRLYGRRPDCDIPASRYTTPYRGTGYSNASYSTGYGTTGYGTGSYGTGSYGTGSYGTGSYGTGNCSTGTCGTSGYGTAGYGNSWNTPRPFTPSTYDGRSGGVGSYYGGSAYAAPYRFSNVGTFRY